MGSVSVHPCAFFTVQLLLLTPLPHQIVVLKVQRHWDDTKNPPVHITLLLEVQVVPHLSHHNTQLSLSCRNTIVGPCEASPCQYRLPAWSRFSLEKAADYYCRLGGLCTLTPVLVVMPWPCIVLDLFGMMSWHPSV